MTCVQHFLLKECFAFDQTFRPTMLKRLAGISTLSDRLAPALLLSFAGKHVVQLLQGIVHLFGLSLKRNVQLALALIGVYLVIA